MKKEKIFEATKLLHKIQSLEQAVKTARAKINDFSEMGELRGEFSDVETGINATTIVTDLSKVSNSVVEDILFMIHADLSMQLSESEKALESM